MKKMAAILASVLMVACATSQKAASPDSSNASQVNGNNATAPDSTMVASVSATKIAANKLNAEVQELQNQSIYFDFDKFSVKPEFQDVIQKEADFIKLHKDEVVTLEGNADERGSNEYNLALGSERAVAVEKSLELQGVPAAQIKTVSYGEEKPRLVCHEEKCWKEDRRVDFVFSSVPPHAA